MGTTIEAWSDDTAHQETLSDLFENVENVCSRFRPNSELSRINRCTSDALTLSPILAGVLHAAERARTITGGLVDIGVGGSVRAWGYDRTFSEVTDLDAEPQLVPAGEWSFDHGSLKRSGAIELDVGGLAKGWTCDRAVESGLASVVSAGGDLRSNAPGTRVSVVGPTGEVDVIVALGVGALATSSTSRRVWRAGGRQVSHVVDPRSSRPVTTPIVSATVIADTAADAEAGAKATLILGVDGLKWAEEQPWIKGALVFWHDGSVFATPDMDVTA